MTEQENVGREEGETPEYFYYVPNEFTIRIEHQIGEQNVATAENLASLFAKNGLESLLPFPFQEPVRSSFPIFSEGEKPSREFTLFTIRPIQPPKDDEPIRIKPIIDAYVDKLGDANYIPLEGGDGPILLQAALPNWYLGSATHQGIGTSGAGSRPRPVPNRKLPVKFVYDSPFDLSECDDCGDVSVYILDTIPPKDRIQSAWCMWGDHSLHPFRRILRPFDTCLPTTDYWTSFYATERADYYYAAPHTFQNTVMDVEGRPHALILRRWRFDKINRKPNNHDNYDLSDHGLFIAGIIHSIAPQTKLTVLQVFNNYGIGTLETIAQGFKRISELHTDRQKAAIVNCSFTIAYPNPDLESPQEVEMSRKAIADLWDSVHQSISTNITIVAAAGNDSNRYPVAPDAADIENARELASTPSAIGVGALQANSIEPASYSNDADLPLNNGFMVFGGDFEGPDPQGVISIFTGNLDIDIDPDNEEGYHMSWNVVNPQNFMPDSGEFEPINTRNHNGYAEWAGTSFATPILVASILRVCCARGCDVKTAIDILRNKPEHEHAAPNETAAAVATVFNKVQQTHS